MIRLALISIRRPKLALAFWGTFAAILMAIGLGVSDRLSPIMTFVPGTESTRAEDLAESQFGPSTLVPILLTGPRAQLDRQGPPLVRALKRRDGSPVKEARINQWQPLPLGTPPTCRRAVAAGRVDA